MVAALIESDGKLLCCQRKRGGAFELLWEFPGGKVHAGETLEAALVRELHEELEVVAEIGPEIYRTQHLYNEMKEPLELVFFSAKITGEIKNNMFEKIEWRAPDTLSALNFLPADRELIEKLANRSLPLPT